MPVVHRYVDGQGYYIKGNIKGKITTYQVTPEGVAYLRKNGLNDHSDISPRRLQYMRDRRMVYTGGGGPGDIGPANKGYGLFGKQSGSKNTAESCGCCGTQALLFLLIPFLLVVWQGRKDA